jgi:hypothetical protein
MTDRATLRAQVEALYRDVGTVLTVAERRTDRDSDYRAMLKRLFQWRGQLAHVLALLDAETGTGIEAKTDTNLLQKTGTGWQPIATAPDDRTWFLAWSADLGFFVYRLGPGLIASEEPDPTHWMPLPAPPGAETGTGLQNLAERLRELRDECSCSPYECGRCATLREASGALGKHGEEYGAGLAEERRQRAETGVGWQQMAPELRTEGVCDLGQHAPPGAETGTAPEQEKP